MKSLNPPTIPVILSTKPKLYTHTHIYIYTYIYIHRELLNQGGRKHYIGGGTQTEGHFGRVSGSEIGHLVWGVRQCKLARGSGDASPGNFDT